jgi:hypothetical protein
MKMNNIKKIALASALVAGNIFSVNVNAQSTTIYNLYSTATNINAGQTALGALTTPISSGATVYYSFTANYVSGPTASPSLALNLSARLNADGSGAYNGTTGNIVIPANNTPALYTGSFVTHGTANSISLSANGSVSPNTIYSIFQLLISLGPAPTPTPTGPSLENTQASVANTAQALQGAYTLQNAVLANSFSYDCSVFGANNVCVSAGGRNTAVSAANGLNNSSALLIAAYRAMANVRVGAYADQNVSVSNSSTVNLGNNTPLLGLFGVWNERLDGTGTEVKVSAAYGQKNTTINRSVVGTGATASEAGSGSSQLNSQGAQLTAKYGFGFVDQVVVSPYVGIRYTQNNMGGYTEGASSSVAAPLTYSALNTNATTALAGVGANYKGIPQTTLFASAGVETDTNTANGSYSATGVTGLTPVNFNSNPVRTRPTATLGATYDVEKNQRVGVTGIYRQEAYQATATTTVMATYTVGF